MTALLLLPLLLAGTGAVVGSPATASAAARQNVNLRDGGVFVQSNFTDGNFIVAYSRTADGTLVEAGRYPTGGTGTGSIEEGPNAMIVGTSAGEASPNNNIESADLLFVANSGSNTISVFRIQRQSLDLVEVIGSGGEKPISLTVNNGVLYVLNSGEVLDHLFDEDGNLLENCTTGAIPTVTGFRVSPRGQLTPIPRSTRTLSGEARSGCAQLSFTPDGRTLVASERVARPSVLNQAADDEGALVTFSVNRDGTLGRKQIFDATGQGPFGFTFTKDGALLVVEQFDAAPVVGAASSYRVRGDSSLVPTSPSIRNFGSDTCWIVITDDQKWAFASSSFDDSRISTYAVGTDGLTGLADPVSTSPVDDSGNDGVDQQATDLTLSKDSRFLYQLNSLTGEMNVWRVEADGSLTSVQRVRPFDLTPEQIRQLTPFGISAT